MLKDHKSAMHLEGGGGTFDKVIRNSNETEQFLNVLLFYNCQLEIMRFIHSFDNMFLLSNQYVTHMNVSKQYNENRGVRALLTSENIKLTYHPLAISFQKWFRSLVQFHSLILWGTVNLYCVVLAHKCCLDGMSSTLYGFR